MSKAVELVINNKTIKVIVPSSDQELLDVLNKFRNNLSHRNTRVIGFESLTEFSGSDAVIGLCDGESCLVYTFVRISQEAQKYLVNFLRLPNVIFVGSGIKSSLRLLEKDYGLHCRNVVELGPLAAPMVHFPSGLSCSDINLSNNWRLPLSQNETALIASTAYSYFDIGCTKLGEIVPANMPATLYFKLTSKMV